jgi:hypothetical protein
LFHFFIATVSVDSLPPRRAFRVSAESRLLWEYKGKVDIAALGTQE